MEPAAHRPPPRGARRLPRPPAARAPRRPRSARSLWGLLAAGALLTAAPTSRAALVPVPLEAGEASASSHGAVNAEPARVWDGIAWKSWVSAPGDARGAWVEIRFSTTRYLRAVSITPGDGRSPSLYKATARPSRVTLSWEGGHKSMWVRDKHGAQRITLPTVAQTTWLRVTVTAIYGKDTRGVAISEITAFEPEDVVAQVPALAKAIRRELRGLSGPQWRDAADRLVRFGRPAVGWLVDEVEHAKPSQAARLFDVLVRFGPDQARDAVAAQLDRLPPRRALPLLRALGQRHIAGLRDRMVQLAATHAPAVRLAAARYLCTAGDPRAAAPLGALLRAGVDDAAKLGAACLPRLGPNGLRAALGAVNASTPACRQAAVVALGGFPDDPDAEAAAIRLSHDADAGPRLAAVETLGKLRGPAAQARLVALITAPDEALRVAAATALAARGAGAVEAVGEVLAQAGPDVAKPLLRLLSAQQTPAARRALIAALVGARAASWRADAERALAAQGLPAIREVTAWIREHPSSARNLETFLTAHASMAAPWVAHALALLPPTWDFTAAHLAFVHTLAAAGKPTYVEPLMAATQNEALSDEVRAAAMEAVGTLGGPKAQAHCLAGLAWPRPGLAGAAAVACARARTPQLVSRLLDALDRQRPDAWNVGFVRALGLAGDPAAVPTLAKGLPLAHPAVQVAILDACRKIHSPEALRVLINASVAPDPYVRGRAQRLLAAADYSGR